MKITSDYMDELFNVSILNILLQERKYLKEYLYIHILKKVILYIYILDR